MRKLIVGLLVVALMALSTNAQAKGTNAIFVAEGCLIIVYGGNGFPENPVKSGEKFAAQCKMGQPTKCVFLFDSGQTGDSGELSLERSDGYNGFMLYGKAESFNFLPDGRFTYTSNRQVRKNGVSAMVVKLCFGSWSVVK